MAVQDSTAPETGISAPAFAGEWRVQADGLVAYPRAMAQMEARVAALRAGEGEELVWLLEHPPTYTSGTSASGGDLLAAQGVEVFSAGRGGQWTYHGPGQRVVYVMLDLNRPHGGVRARDLHDYVDGLERWIIAALAGLGVAGMQRRGRVGIWVIDPRTGQEAKIAAIGVRITRWISWHGIAINVAPNLAHYGGIVPCGISEFGVTSLAALGSTAGMAELDAALAASWPGIFG